MSTITMSRQTSLSGAALQNAVDAMVRQMVGRSPYSLLSPRLSWDSGRTRLTLQAGNHMTGVIALQSGNPSTVTAQINLLSGIAESYRSRVESDMQSLASQYLAGTAAAAPAAAAPGVIPTTTTPRRTFDWSTFGTVLSGVFTGAAQGLESYNQQVQQDAAASAVAIAQQEASAVTGKQIDTGPVSPEDETPWEAFTELITGEPETEEAPAEGAAVVQQPAGFPTWGWVAIGVGGVAVLGLLIWALTGDDKKKEDRRDRRDDEDLKENYGFRYFL